MSRQQAKHKKTRQAGASVEQPAPVKSAASAAQPGEKGAAQARADSSQHTHAAQERQPRKRKQAPLAEGQSNAADPGPAAGEKARKARKGKPAGEALAFDIEKTGLRWREDQKRTDVKRGLCAPVPARSLSNDARPVGVFMSAL